MSPGGGMGRLRCSRRSGSARASIRVIFPLVTVNAITENTRPAGGYHGSRGAVDQRWPDKRGELGVGGGVGRHGLRSAEDQRCVLAQHAAVDPQFDAGIEHRDQGVEVAIARGGEERANHLLLPGGASGRAWGELCTRSPGPAGELLARRLRNDAGQPRCR